MKKPPPILPSAEALWTLSALNPFRSRSDVILGARGLVVGSPQSLTVYAEPIEVDPASVSVPWKPERKPATDGGGDENTNGYGGGDEETNDGGGGGDENTDGAPGGSSVAGAIPSTSSTTRKRGVKTQNYQAAPSW